MTISDAVFSEPRMRRIQDGIVNRQKEMHDIAEMIAKKAHRLTWRSQIIKVITVVLGAVAAAKGSADIILGADGPINVAMFALIGVLVSSAAGIEAAFQYEKRGTQLTILASLCQATVSLIASEWIKRIGSSEIDDDIRIRDEARALMDLLDQKLAYAQEEAAKLNVNITLEIYELSGQKYRDRFAA